MNAGNVSKEDFSVEPRVYAMTYGCFQNRGTPKSSILIGFSIINHPFWVFYPYFGKHPYDKKKKTRCGNQTCRIMQLIFFAWF